MEVIQGIEAFPTQRVPVALALGTFDGVHRGHQALITASVQCAHEVGGRAVVLTFDPHPLQVIAPPPEPFLLTMLEERVSLFAGLGADFALVIRFDAAVQQISATDWIALLVHRVGMTDVFSSVDHTFGRDRGGNVELLRRRAQADGFAVHLVPPVHVGGTLVSSTLIRRLLRAGAVREAARYLGRWYALAGRVIEGDRRGTALGFPTANFFPSTEKVLPALGTYAAFARTEREVYHAAVSIGTRPTFGPGPLLVEAHLLDFAQPLYGETLTLQLVDRLHDDIAFPTTESLVRQMTEDVAETRRLLRVAAHEQLC